MDGYRRAFSLRLQDIDVLDGHSCECILSRILDYIQKWYRRGCSVGMVVRVYTGQVQLCIYRSAGLLTEQVQTLM